MKQLGGPDYPGIGFATGIERLCQTMLEENLPTPPSPTLDYYLIPLDDDCNQVCFNYLMELRKQGFSALLHYKNYNIKKGLRAAESAQAHYAIIVGEEELKNNQIKLKDLFKREEKLLPISFPMELSK